MDKRAVSVGVAVSIAAWFVSRLITSTRHSVMQQIDVEAGLVVVGSLYQLAATLVWLAGGIAVGYLCSGKPIKNGAITGAIYGLLFCLFGLVLMKMDSDAGPMELAHMLRLIATIAQYAFLFVLYSCFGFALRAGRRI